MTDSLQSTLLKTVGYEMIWKTKESLDWNLFSSHGKDNHKEHCKIRRLNVTMNRDELWAFPQVGKFYVFSSIVESHFSPNFTDFSSFDSLFMKLWIPTKSHSKSSISKRISLWFINFTFLMNLCMQLTALFQFFWTFFTLHCWEAF